MLSRFTRFAPIWLLSLLLAGAVHGQPPALKLSADFPGGSARVESIDQEKRALRIVPQPHLERGWDCWWYFKVEGIVPGETLTIDVGGGAYATPDRAHFSLDQKEWQPTEPGQREKQRIVYRQRVDAKEAWFAWGPPFVLKDAKEILEAAAKKYPYATVFELAKSKDGRSVPGLRIQQPGVKDEERLGIWVQARQHAWESGSSWVCQGFLQWVLSDDPAAAALRQKATFFVVPIMDVDNVERGAGGKNQKPHDHNRDWNDTPVWPEVTAAQKRLQELDQAGRLDLFLDLHNPGANDKQPFFFVAPPDTLTPQARRNLDRFLESARKEMVGPLKLAAKPRESGPNYDPNWQVISKNWVVKHSKPHVVAVTLETSWNTPHSTPAGYQQVGKELGQAVARYLQEGNRAK